MMTGLTLKDLWGAPRPFHPPLDAPASEGKKNWWPRTMWQLRQAKVMKALADGVGLSPLEQAEVRSLLTRFDHAERDGEVPDTLASPVRWWELRTPVIGHLWKLVEEYGLHQVALVTLRPHSLLVEGRDLAAFDPRRARRQLRNHLDRAGVTEAEGFLIMGLDAEFDANRGEGGLYDWHWHGIVGGEKVRLIDELLRGRRAYKNHRVHRLEQGLSEHPRVKVQRGLVNLPTPLAYGFKGWVPHRPTFLQPDGTRERSERKRQIPSPYLQQWMLWMDQWNMDDLVLRNDLEITKSGFQISPGK